MRLVNLQEKRHRNSSFQRLLGVERSEAPLVFPLFLHNFFLGAGIAFLFTTSSAIFIHEFEGPTLALAFVVAGALMLATARIYAHFEHKLLLDKYLPAVVLALPVIVLAVRLSGYVMNHAIAAFAMLVAYRIIYMLANLEFWGLTSLVFNIRQSKRLFGLIGSGDIPAKMLGYLAVSLLSKAVAPEDLLYVSVVAFLVAWIMLQRVLRNPAALAHIHKHSHHHGHAKHHKSPESFVQKFFGSHFVMSLAIFALMTSLAMALVDYSFYGKVKLRYKSSNELAGFLGYFLTLSMVATFALKLLFSGKLLQRIGVSAVLLFLPILLLLPCIYLLLPIPLNLDEKLLLWFFSIMYLLRDVFKYTLVDPMFLALFQPLNSHLRLKGHTIVKGLVDPLGLLLMGALIFLGEKVVDENIFKLLAAGMAAVCILWILAARRLSREWLEMLRTSVRKRFLDGQSVTMGGKTTADLLLAKLDSDQASEGIYALRMLEDIPQVDYEKVLLTALGKKVPETQLYALQKLEQRNIPVPSTTLERMAITSKNPQLQTLASKMLLRTEMMHLKYAAYAAHQDEALKRGAIAGLLLSDDPAANRKGETQLHKLIESFHPEDKNMALWLIHETGQQDKDATVHRMLDSDSALVVHGAIQAAGKLGKAEFLEKLLALTQKPNYRSAAIEALSNYEVAQIKAHAKGDNALLRTLCRLAGKPDSLISSDFLIEQMSSNDASLRREAIHALMKRGYKAPHDRRLREHIARLQLQLFAAMEQYEGFLATDNGKPLAKALETELHGMVDQLLICFSFQYDSRTVMRVRHGLQFKSEELRADALEILDHLLPRGQAHRLLHLLEVLYLDRSKKQPTKTTSHTLLQGCERLMKEASAVHDAWTVCLATDHYVKSQPNPVQDLVETAMAATTPFLSKYSLWLRTHHPTILNVTSMSQHADGDHAFSPLEMVLMLKASKIFAETPENTLAEVAAIAVVEQVMEGDVLFRKGDPGDCMYIIAEGEIKIGDGATLFATLGKSDFFGELALVETEPRSADAVAATDCLLIRIDQDDFYELIEDRTEVARGILVILAQRLRRQNEIIRKLKEGK
jgi:ATP/ADP translocase